jgi:putative lipoprotein
MRHSACPGAIVGLVTIICVAACSPEPAQPTATMALAEESVTSTQLTGTVSYRERIALLPGSELNIKLLDVSVADAAADVLAELNMPDPGQVPINFQLPYDPALIDERMSYTVRAEIRIDGRLVFTTDTAHPVLTRGAGKNVAIKMVKVARQQPVEGLTDTTWKLREINGVPIRETEGSRPAYIRLGQNHQLNGFGGCNNFSGGWQLNAEQLQLGPLAMTAMACATDMDNEQQFLQALEEVERHNIERGELSFYKGEKTILLLRASD